MSFRDLPIATCPLNAEERDETIEALRTFALDLGAPGDYGYESRLGIILKVANELRVDLEKQRAAALVPVGG